jgi:hypothetical protein
MPFLRTFPESTLVMRHAIVILRAPALSSGCKLLCRHSLLKRRVPKDHGSAQGTDQRQVGSRSLQGKPPFSGISDATTAPVGESGPGDAFNAVETYYYKTYGLHCALKGGFERWGN